MSLLTDTKYISLISNRLARFKKLKPTLYRFRCPVCGDSKKDKTKARGFILPNKKNNGYIMKCHNCGISMSFSNLLKRIDPILFEEYQVEGLAKPLKQKEEKKIEVKTPVFKTEENVNKKFFEDLTPVANLKEGHPVREYLIERGISKLDRFFLIGNFKEWSNKIKPGTFKTTKYDTPRLIIPFYDFDGKVFAYQGRSFDPKEKQFKYITIKLDESMPKVYGLDTVDRSKNVNVVEGPIDSLFVNNAVASGGSDLIELAGLFPHKTFIFDNEPRSKEIVKKIQEAIKCGHNVVIWSSKIKPGMDINDMVLAGINVNREIKERTFTGLQAQLEFRQWRKI